MSLPSLAEKPNVSLVKNCADGVRVGCTWPCSLVSSNARRAVLARW